ncbi:MAG: hypothetical protein QXO67_02725 [Candidatus Bathyarchaeia archaeon]
MEKKTKRKKLEEKIDRELLRQLLFENLVLDAALKMEKNRLKRREHLSYVR